MQNVLLLLDTSGSMHGEKISALVYAVERFICGIKNITLCKEPSVAVITFGGNPAWSDFLPLSKFTLSSVEARGETKLTEALRKAAYMSVPETVCVLVSDGMAMDGGFAKVRLECKAYAIAIGYDADLFMLSRFTGSNERVFLPFEAERLPGYMMRHDFSLLEKP